MSSKDHSIAIGHFLDSDYSLEFESMHLEISRKLEECEQKGRYAGFYRHEAFYVMAKFREFEGRHGGTDEIQRKHVGPRSKSMVSKHDSLVADLLAECIG